MAPFGSEPQHSAILISDGSVYEVGSHEAVYDSARVRAGVTHEHVAEFFESE